jgi:hypothetical protein
MVNQLSSIVQKLMNNLKEKEKIVISRRFGFGGKERETLEKIGKDFGVSRERIRQIQEVAMNKLKSQIKDNEEIREIFQKVADYLGKFGDARKEETLLEELAQKEKNELLFLMQLSPEFKRFPEDREFWSFWTKGKKAEEKVREIINKAISILKEKKKPLSLEEFNFSLPKEVIESYLEISKNIGKTKNGLFGLMSWPEVNPKRIKDKAYLVLKEIGQPLHFKKIAELIPGANTHTVHNELIKDPRFVLIGRGIYALAEWGYIPGQVKDIILKVLKEEGRPLTKEEIIEKVLKQRVVKKTTILMNLNDSKYFIRDEAGKYKLRTEIA